MVGLPRMYIRQLTYLLGFSVFAIVLVMIANQQNMLVLDNLLPYKLTPAFFQPAADNYIVDISIGTCYRYNWNNDECGVPLSGDGALGELHEAGGWLKIDKDLLLKSSWVTRRFFSYKRVKAEALKDLQKFSDGSTKEDVQVVVDIALVEANDAKIKGNEKLHIPLKILKEFHTGKAFDEDEYRQLMETQAELQKGETFIQTDKDKAASNKINELNAKLEKEAQEQEEILRESEEQAAEALQQEELGVEEEAPEKSPLQKTKEEEEALREAEAKEAEKLAVQEGKAKGKGDGEKSKGEKPKEKGKKSKGKGDKPKEKTKEPSKGKATKEAEEALKSSKEKAAKKIKDTKKDKEKRGLEKSRDNLSVLYTIPTKEELSASGWRFHSHGIWLKFGPVSKKAITGIDVLFGKDAVEPRPNWKMLSGTIQDIGSETGRSAKLSIRRGPRVDFKLKEFQPKLKLNSDHRFKILQVADLHFSTGVGKCLKPEPKENAEGCEADPRTLEFLNHVLDVEKPDFVVLTGDQTFGETSPDTETALFKALNPFISRKIPYAIVLGNHDAEGSLDRVEVMSLSSDLPYSVSSLGPKEIAGVGNYVVEIKGAQGKHTALLLFFLDSHSYSPNPKVNPGYDWIKENQLKWLEGEAARLKKDVSQYSHTALSMAFFHIPLPEYRNLQQPYIGEVREKITAPIYNTGARQVLSRIGVHAVSVGHDHANDYCLLDTQNAETNSENKLWLCYGGGAGEGGYGGYNYIRRVRVFEFDTNNGEIETWKRTQHEPDVAIDHQTLTSGGSVVNYE